MRAIQTLLLIIILQFVVSIAGWATNPIISTTTNSKPSASCLTTYCNGTPYASAVNNAGCIFKAGDTYWLASTVSHVGGDYYDQIAIAFQYTSAANLSAVLAGTQKFTYSNYTLPYLTAAQGYVDCIVGDPYVWYDPVEGIWYVCAIAFKSSCPGNPQGSGSFHCYEYSMWYCAGSADTFPASGSWSASPSEISYSLFTSFTAGPDTCIIAPKAGGGYVGYFTLAGFLTGSSVSGHLVTTTSDSALGTWSTAALALSGNFTGDSGYIEYMGYFVYAKKYYLIANRSATAGGSNCYLYSCDTQTGTWTPEANLTTGGIISTRASYVTSILDPVTSGQTLNSGTAYGSYQGPTTCGDGDVYDYGVAYGVGGTMRINTFTATPVSSPSPTVSGITSSFSSGTFSISGAASPGNGADLWEVGIYNQTTGARSKATWGSWSGNPGASTNTFSGTISGSAGDSVLVTVYDVTLDSDGMTLAEAQQLSPGLYNATLSGGIQLR